MTKLMNSPKRAIAAASFRRLSPSIIRDNLRGAEIDRKMLTTAEGSVVDTIAPINRQAASGSDTYPTERITNGKCCHNHRHNGHHQDGHPVVQHPAQVHAECRLKEQRWQENIEEHVRTDRQINNRLRPRVQRIRQVGIETRMPRRAQSLPPGRRG